MKYTALPMGMLIVSVLVWGLAIVMWSSGAFTSEEERNRKHTRGHRGDAESIRLLEERSLSEIANLLYKPGNLSGSGVAVNISDKNPYDSRDRFIADVRRNNYEISCVESLIHTYYSSDRTELVITDSSRKNKRDIWLGFLYTVRILKATGSAINIKMTVSFDYEYIGPDVSDYDLNITDRFELDSDPENPRYDANNWKLREAGIKHVTDTASGCADGKVYYTHEYLYRNDGHRRAEPSEERKSRVRDFSIPGYTKKVPVKVNAKQETPFMLQKVQR